MSTSARVANGFDRQNGTLKTVVIGVGVEPQASSSSGTFSWPWKRKHSRDVLQTVGESSPGERYLFKTSKDEVPRLPLVLDDHASEDLMSNTMSKPQDGRLETLYAAVASQPPQLSPIHPLFPCTKPPPQPIQPRPPTPPLLLFSPNCSSSISTTPAQSTQSTVRSCSKSPSPSTTDSPPPHLVPPISLTVTATPMPQKSPRLSVEQTATNVLVASTPQTVRKSPRIPKSDSHPPGIGKKQHSSEVSPVSFSNLDEGGETKSPHADDNGDGEMSHPQNRKPRALSTGWVDGSAHKYEVPNNPPGLLIPSDTGARLSVPVAV